MARGPGFVLVLVGICSASFLLQGCTEDSGSDKLVVAETAPVVLPLTTSAGSQCGLFTVGLGTPPTNLSVSFDAGSFVFWASKPYDPAKSSSAEPLNLTLECVYGSGVIKGAMYQETVTLYSGDDSFEVSGINVTHATEKIDEHIEALMGMDQDSVTAHKILAGLGVPKHYSYNLLKADWPANGEFVPSGNVTLGGVDHDAYLGGLYCAPVVPLSERNTHAKTQDAKKKMGVTIDGVPADPAVLWQFQLSEVSVSGKVQNLANPQAIVDTGAQYFLVPASIGELIAWPNINTAQEGLSCEKAKEELPTLTFTLANGNVLSMGPEDYSFTIKGSPDTCFPNYEIWPDPETFIFGVPFQWKYYVVFDYDNEQLAFGLKSGFNGSELDATCAQSYLKRG